MAMTRKLWPGSRRQSRVRLTHCRWARTNRRSFWLGGICSENETAPMLCHYRLMNKWRKYSQMTFVGRIRWNDAGIKNVFLRQNKMLVFISSRRRSTRCTRRSARAAPPPLGPQSASDPSPSPTAVATHTRLRGVCRDDTETTQRRHPTVCVCAACSCGCRRRTRRSRSSSERDAHGADAELSAEEYKSTQAPAGTPLLITVCISSAAPSFCALCLTEKYFPDRGLCSAC